MILLTLIGGLVLLWYDSVLFAHTNLFCLKGYLLMCLLSFALSFLRLVGFTVIRHLLQLVFLVCVVAQILSWVGLIALPLINYIH